jgi:mono/diheme cytochrome c family protein
MAAKQPLGRRERPLSCAPRRSGAWVALALLLPGASVQAQDALQGKRLYLDVGRLRGSGVSCVDCHGGLPGGQFGIGRAANDPAAVERAVNSIPQMTPLRGRLIAQDFADLAAYLGNPSVPSPVLRTAVIQAGSAPSSAERVDFGEITSGQTSPAASITLLNDGAVALRWTSAVRVVGPNSAEYSVRSSGCTSGTVLGPGLSCEITVSFQPDRAATGLRSAALQIDHDWVGGAVAVALLGTAAASSAMAPLSPAGPGGGGASSWLLAVLFCAALPARGRAERV